MSTGARSTSQWTQSTSPCCSGDVQAYLSAAPDLFVQDLYTGADPAHRLRVPLRHAETRGTQLFVRNMFIRPVPGELAGFEENFTVLHAPEFRADPARHATRTTTFIVLNLRAIG